MASNSLRCIILDGTVRKAETEIGRFTRTLRHSALTAIWRILIGASGAEIRGVVKHLAFFLSTYHWRICFKDIEPFLKLSFRGTEQEERWRDCPDAAGNNRFRTPGRCAL